jgi:two-component system cell cycle sensor histidine kinase/response regulator CckA
MAVVSDISTIFRGARAVSMRNRVFLALSVAALTAVFISDVPEIRIGCAAAAATFLAQILLSHFWRRLMRWRERRRLHELAALTAHDATPCFTTDSFGHIRYLNAAAQGRFSAPARRVRRARMSSPVKAICG